MNKWTLLIAVVLVAAALTIIGWRIYNSHDICPPTKWIECFR